MASSGEASGEGKEVTFSGNPNTGTVTEAVVNSENGASGENDQSDGTKFNLGVGDIMLAEDISGQGHTTRVIGDSERISIAIPVE